MNFYFSDIDRKHQPTEIFMSEFISKFLSTLLVVPVSGNIMVPHYHQLSERNEPHPQTTPTTSGDNSLKVFLSQHSGFE